MVANARILVVDDDASMARSVRALLSAQGFVSVTVLTDAASAVAHLASEQFDLVLLDNAMPGMTGLQVLDAIDQAQQPASIIMMTGDATVDTAISALRHGAADYLRKPFEPGELAARVDHVLSIRVLSERHTRTRLENLDLEHRLRQAQKMEAIGALAGGVAHDFNNILAVILGNTELARIMVDADHPVQDNLEKVETASTRARELVEQLLAFSRSNESAWRPLELNTVVRECMALMRSSIPPSIHIHQHAAESALFIEGDATQIHQIVINLCTNAAQAMHADGGVLEVGVSIGQPPDTTGEWVRLTVRDSGEGIAEDVLPRVFEPYFTTKRPGQGTGMGLAVVHGIVDNHTGRIEIDSSPGRGTTVDVYLPLAEHHDDAGASGEPPELQHGSERIMFIDDDTMVVDVIERMLEQLGYHVAAFEDSEVALRAFLEEPQAYDLVVSDLTMPGLMGDELARRIHEHSPELPIVICSGYNEAVDVAQLKRCGVRDFLKKPAQLPELAGTLRSVLDRVQERRLERRYRIPEGAFVIFQDHPLLRAKLIDLSESGLAVSLEGEPGEFDSDSVDRVSIISTVDGRSVDAIRCEAVDASDIDASDRSLRRWGIRFAELTTAQVKALDEFIDAQRQDP